MYHYGTSCVLTFPNNLKSWRFDLIILTIQIYTTLSRTSNQHLIMIKIKFPHDSCISAWEWIISAMFNFLLFFLLNVIDWAFSLPSTLSLSSPSFTSTHTLQLKAMKNWVLLIFWHVMYELYAQYWILISNSPHFSLAWL